MTGAAEAALERALVDWGADPASVVPLAGDASTRHYVRVRRGDATAVIMICGEPLPSEHCAIEGFAFARWQGFYRDIGVRVPAILGVRRERGLVLLEDLGDELLQHRAERRGPLACRDEYRRAIEWMRAIATRGTARFVPAEHPDEDPLTPARLAVEMDLFLAHAARVEVAPPSSGGSALQRATAALDRHARGPLGRARQLLHRLCHEVHDVAGGESAMTLCHRDYHARNLVVVPEGDREELAVIDFQDTRRGPRAYDLASLAWDPYVALPQELVEELVELARPEGVPADGWSREVALCAGQRLLKAAGSYAYLLRERDRGEYARWLPVALERARQRLEPWPHAREAWSAMAEAGIALS